ncbi:MAG: periplasmic heavy metal sensor [Gammaproteobacteria bacterium]|nr:periplasmic heavy metal sensor [Gammaproteobacteria bacterium]MXY54937.1 periplasmic heavy metal sensor [Gammaproteobacteria bacterium]MYF29217.1 periplasmic heavy metal sensor [Gammaproteobacteria bacterium]MYK47203.1 periplasmic heavy metal sensor [Gammaproteobacteria bacterium]
MRSRWLVIALAISVALNVGMLGLGIGFATGSPHWGRGVDPTAGLARLIRSLPEARREELTRTGAPAISDGELRRRLGASMRDLRTSQRLIASALAEEPFDPGAATAALARFRQHFAANQASSHEAFVAILDRLTPEERRRFLDTMRPGKDRRGRHGPRPRPEGVREVDRSD